MAYPIYQSDPEVKGHKMELCPLTESVAFSVDHDLKIILRKRFLRTRKYGQTGSHHFWMTSKTGVRHGRENEMYEQIKTKGECVYDPS